MALNKLWTIALRDLGRNRRRSLLTLAAVALGLALLIVMHGLTTGIIDDTMENSIRLETGHVQVRAASYEREKLSLQWKDLLENPDELAAMARAMPEVQTAAPVLWAGGFVDTAEETAGVQIYGIDTASGLFARVREGMVGGSWLAPDDRDGVVIGRRLANSLGLAVGQKVSLTVVDADNRPDEGLFTIRGLFATDTPSYDETAVFMPLAKAQAFTNTPGRASAVVLLLKSGEDADRVAAALQSSGVHAVTWRDINAALLGTLQVATSFYVVLDIIVMLVVAVLIANTLLMAAFERIREMGILAALGMRGRQIMLMFLLEAAALAFAGIVLGAVLGVAGVAYLARFGIHVGDTMSAAANNLAMGTTLYAHFAPATFASLAVSTLIIVLLAALYPARFAAHREPAEALRAL